MKKFIIAIILFAILFMGSIAILPGLTVRNIVIICLLFYVLANLRKVCFDIAEKSYLFFVLVLLLCNILSGNVTEFAFIQNFVSYHLACIVIIMALPMIIKTDKEIKFATSALIIFYVFNVLATYLQFVNDQYGWDIAYAITPGFETNMEERMEYLDGLDDMTSIAITPGITGFVVTNGYFSATFLPIICYMYLSNGFKNFVLGLALMVVGFAGLYMIQQRTAFFIAILCILIMLLVRARRNWVIPIICCVLLSCLVYPYFDEFEMGRLVIDDVLTDDRSNLMEFFFAYIDQGNFWFGGKIDSNWGLTLGHNTIFSALLYGGIFTMIVYIFVLAIIGTKCIKSLFSSLNTGNSLAFVYTLSCCLYIGVSMTHSSGIQSGAIMFWISYVLMLQAAKQGSFKSIMSTIRI